MQKFCPGRCLHLSLVCSLEPDMKWILKKCVLFYFVHHGTSGENCDISVNSAKTAYGLQSLQTKISIRFGLILSNSICPENMRKFGNLSSRDYEETVFSYRFLYINVIIQIVIQKDLDSDSKPRERCYLLIGTWLSTPIESMSKYKCMHISLMLQFQLVKRNSDCKELFGLRTYSFLHSPQN